MVREVIVPGVMIAVTAATIARAAQHEGHQAAGAVPQTNVDIAQCARAQATVARLIDAAKLRLESARQANSASAMRDAVDDFQAVLVGIRAQLAPCAAVQASAAGPHAGHAMPSVQQAPAAAPGQSGAPTPGAGAPAALAPAGVDPHAGHGVPAPPTRTGGPASAVPRQTPSEAADDSPAGHAAPAASRVPRRSSAAPAAADSHAGHAMPTAPAATKETGTADSRATARSSLTPAPLTDIANLKCRTRVDPKAAPRMLFQGRMYYFCSEEERAAFAKDPTKYALPAGQAAPAHGH